jgi:GTP-binding protein YchF
MGIVGLPNAGKSTLFNALTNAGVLAASYPFATIDPNVGVVPVPDPRLDRLAEISGSAKTTPATVRFVDIAGLVRGASKGEGLGNRFLANIRDVTAVCHVVRAFSAPAVAHVEDEVDPLRDIETVDTELALADLETVERRLQRVEREATADPRLRRSAELLERAEEVLAVGGLVTHDPGLAKQDELADLLLLTAKPAVYVFNADQELLDDEEKMEELAGAVAPSMAVFLDADLESELAELGPEETAEMLESLGMDQPGLDKLVRAAFRALDLQTFVTTNPNETRAWTIRSGTTAVEAAAEVHTDFARGFIAAEVIDYEELVEAGSWQAARARGQVRTEGRDYVMRLGDVVEFRFNL